MKRRDITPFGLRMQPELREKAKSEAEQNRRSMNTEIEMLIEDGFRWREMQKRQAMA